MKAIQTLLRCSLMDCLDLLAIIMIGGMLGLSVAMSFVS